MNPIIKENFRYIVWILIAIVLILSVYGFLNRNKKKKQIDELYTLIDSGINQDGDDLKTILYKVTPDNAFLTQKMQTGLTFAENASKIIYECFYYDYPLVGYQRRPNDDEKLLKSTISSKTKAQIAAIAKAFAIQYGVELDEFLRSGSSASEMREYYTIIKNLK